MFFGKFSHKDHHFSYNALLDLSNEVSYMSNGDNLTMLQPQDIGCPTNPNGVHKLLVLHLVELGFWFFGVFSYCSIIKKSLEPHYNSVQRHVNTTYFYNNQNLFEGYEKYW